jgi:ABC-2 type transport system permease protein
MRQIYLIARREYLAYVGTIRFWISLLLMPVFMSVGFIAFFIADRAAPTRYYTVIAEEPALADALRDGMARERASEVAGQVRAFATMRGLDPATTDRAVEAARNARGEGAGLAAAAEIMNMPGATAIEISPPKLVEVDPPARDVEGLRPYLLGEASIDTPEGPRGLHAAVFLRRGANGEIEIDYWSAALTNTDLADEVRSAMRTVMREEAFAAAGLTPEVIAEVNQISPDMVELNPERARAEAEITTADRLPYIAGFALGFFLWMIIMSVISILLTSIIEEKSNKILESLLASARFHEILTGKLVGVAAVSATVMLVWGGAAFTAMNFIGGAGVTLPGDIAGTVFDPGLLIPFAIYFVLGYLMFGAVFLAIGSLCETIQEAQSLMSPMMIVLMVPMLMLPLAIRDPDSPAIAIMSWVPIYTPFMMMIRLPSEPAWWEIAGSMAVLAGTAALVLWAAGNVFRAGVSGMAGPDALRKSIARLFRRGRASREAASA